MVFFGSMMKTERMVNAIPFWSMLVMSWWSSLVSQMSVHGGRKTGGKCLHIVEVCNLTLLVTDNWEVDLVSRDLLDILDPSSVRLNSVGRKTDQLCSTLVEFRLELCESTQLSCADWSVIFWVGEKDNPVVADELVEVDRTLGGLGFEVWGNGSQSKATNMTLARVDWQTMLPVDD